MDTNKNQTVKTQEMKEYIVKTLGKNIVKVGREAEIDSPKTRNSLSSRLLNRTAFTVDDYVKTCEVLGVPFEKFIKKNA